MFSNSKFYVDKLCFICYTVGKVVWSAKKWITKKEVTSMSMVTTFDITNLGNTKVYDAGSETDLFELKEILDDNTL